MTDNTVKTIRPPTRELTAVTEEEILAALRQLLVFGFGRLEITVTHHQIHTYHLGYTRLAQRPRGS